MNTSDILQKTAENYQDESLFFAALALELLETSSIFSLLESGEEVKKHLMGILGSKKATQPVLYPFKKDKEVTIPHRLERLSSFQRQLLSCPTNDEHVLLLVSLKALEELGKSTDYKTVLKEILMKNLHKIENISDLQTFIGRQKEIEEIKRILQRSFRNSVLLIGATGVGKTTLAQVLKKYIKETKVFQLFSGNSAFFDQVINILSTTEGKKTLLFMDELFTFEAGHIKYAVENCQIIGTANDISYKKFASENPGIISRFEVITIDEPIIEETKKILSSHQKRITEQMKISYEQDFLTELLTLAKQYIPDQFFPAKGINLLEETALLAKTQGTSHISKELLRVIISEKTAIPIGSLTEFDKKDLSQLPNKLKEKVKGQGEAIEKVAGTIQRARLGFKKPNKPIGSFLFIGPSGVGKTELSKAIAKEVFGDEEAMIRLDMSEFAEAHMVQRLIGSPPGYIGFEEGGQLTNPIKTKPYNLVLLDEIEKAHPRVFDIFLQVLDDGRLTDGQGKKVDFRNTVIVATSNAGIEDMLDMIEEGKTHEEMEKEIKEVLSDYFRVEFINRFDSIVIFNPLLPPALEGIAKIQIQKLQQELEKRKILLSVSDATIAYLAKESYDPRYGARGLLRMLQDTIENKLAEMIIHGQLKEGEKVEF